jgi:hypothetical protein
MEVFYILVKPDLQVDVDGSIIVMNAEKLIHSLLREQSTHWTVEWKDHVQACAIANVSESLLGSSFEVWSLNFGIVNRHC